MNLPNQNQPSSRIQRIWLKIVKGFLRLGNSIINAGFYILWSIVLPLTIIFASQGNEMTEYIFYQKNWIQLAAVLVSLVLLGYALWIIPAMFLQLIGGILKTKKSKFQLFDMLNAHRKDLDSTHLELRLFAIVPLAIFIGGLLLPYLHNGMSQFAWLKKFDHLYVLTIIIIIVLAVLLVVFQRVFYTYQKRFFLFGLNCKIIVWAKRTFIKFYYKDVSNSVNINEASNDSSTIEKYRAVLINGNAFNLLNLFGKALFLGILIVFNGFFFEYRIVLICYLNFFLVWHYGVLQFIDNKSYVERTSLTKDSAPVRFADFVMMRFNYIFLLSFVAILFGWIIYKSVQDDIGFFSPLFIIGILFTFFLLVFDIFYKTPKLLTKLFSDFNLSSMRIRLVRVGLFIMMVVFWVIALFGNANQHRIRKYVAKDEYIHPDQRATLSEFYQQWKSQRDTVHTIFLVSGQGGGSRAAAWTHFCLDTLNINKKFIPNVFAFSTASGSSVGVNMILAQHKIDSPRYYYDSKKDVIVDRLRVLYTRNYFSNSFYGLLFGDMIEGLLNRRKHFNIDRNYRLQKEEMNGFMETFQVKNPSDSLLVQSHFEKDYLKLYYKSSGKLFDKKLPPLFMINSTRVQDANRVLISPIIVPYLEAMDFYSYFKFCKESTAYAIPTVTAVGQSQAFPLISSQNFVEDFGNLADGGFVENSGCGTLLNVYKELRKIVEPGMRIVIVDLQNSGTIVDSAFARTDFDDTENINATLSSMISVLSQTGVSAYSDFWRESLRRQTLLFAKDSLIKDTFITIGLDQDITLARMLSNRSIDSLEANLRHYNNQTKIEYIHSLIK